MILTIPSTTISIPATTIFLPDAFVWINLVIFGFAVVYGSFVFLVPDREERVWKIIRLIDFFAYFFSRLFRLMRPRKSAIKPEGK